MRGVEPLPSPPRLHLAAEPTLTPSGLAWHDAERGAVVGFLGRGGAPRAPIGEVVPPLVSSHHDASWLTQVHGNRVVEAASGPNGCGDALVSSRSDLALVVVTADCVPVLLARGARLAAVHAGWRGIVAGVVRAAIERLGSPTEPLTAWIGPAIGACCYEVGEDVASQVASAAGSEAAVVHRGAGRPHLDLRRAVEAQLSAAGVGEVRHLALCTRCHPDLLWSFRREGPGAGRNLAWIARRAAAGAAPAPAATG